MTTSYKAYTIVTETPKHPGGGWTASVSIYDANGAAATKTLDLGRDVIFATNDLAVQAALLLGRAWVDRLS